MADDKHHAGEELNKSSAVECEATASKLLSLVDANLSNSNLTPEENKRILRKLDRWSVFPAC
jgi:hypothetical protein